MEQKYFLHRIQIEHGNVVKGIEVHDTLDPAILSFWGRMKLGYNNPQHPNLILVSCKITDMNGNIIEPYNMIWQKNDIPKQMVFGSNMIYFADPGRYPGKIRSFCSRLINSSVLSVFPLHPVCTIHAQTASEGVRIGEPAETINECS